MKTKSITALTFILAMALIATMDSCAKANSTDVNQDKIYTTYEVFYNANSDKTWVTANFRLAGPTGTNLELDSTSYVLFNGDTLPYNWLFQSHFKEYAGRITTGTFVYENIDGDVFTNSLPLVDTATFQAGFDTIKKSIANTVTWNGTPLAPYEFVGLFVGSWAWGQDALAIQDGDGATNLVLGTGQLSPLAVGTATVYMDRSKQVTATQAPPLGGGGTIKATYRPLNATVQVIN